MDDCRGGWLCYHWSDSFVLFDQQKADVRILLYLDSQLFDCNQKQSFSLRYMDRKCPGLAGCWWVKEANRRMSVHTTRDTRNLPFTPDQPAQTEEPNETGFNGNEPPEEPTTQSSTLASRPEAGHLRKRSKLPVTFEVSRSAVR